MRSNNLNRFLAGSAFANRYLAKVFYLLQELRNCHNTRLVRDTENIVAQSVTATAIKREENLHRFLPPLQEKCQVA